MTDHNKKFVEAIASEGPVFGLRHENKRNVLPYASSCSDGLDPKAQKILDVINTSPMNLDAKPSSIRTTREALGNPYAHQDIPKSKIEKIDILVPCNERALPARVYRPYGALQQELPALVYFHGGGFVLGSISSYDRVLSQLAYQANVVVISVEYRLAPETPFPGAVHDAIDSFNWIVREAKDLRVDSSRLVIGGDSAGGNLAAAVCVNNRDLGLKMPILQLLIYPSIIGNDSSESRKLFAEGLFLTKDTLKWFHDHYISKECENDQRFNILKTSDFSNLPPAFVLTGGFDPLRDEGQSYVDSLRSSGVSVRHSCYTDMFHGFLNFGVLTQSQEAVSECASVLSDFVY